MPEQLGFETMLIIDPWGMAFHAVGVIGLTFDFLFKMVSSYCAPVLTCVITLHFLTKVYLITLVPYLQCGLMASN